MKAQALIELWRLSRKRLCSEQDYSDFQAYQARQLVNYLSQSGVALQGQRLLDLGSGIGGYSREFARAGAQVISADIMSPRRTAINGLVRVQANALAIPLADNEIDLVFCASLIEHLAKPERALAEIERVLKIGGVCYLSFPPYYSPLGGHEFSPFHYLGERLAMRFVRRQSKIPEWLRNLYRIPDQEQSFSSLYPGWGLYKMTIRKFRRLVSETRLVCWKASTRYLPVSFVRWPLLGEVLTWHAQFLLVKPPATGMKF